MYKKLIKSYKQECEAAAHALGWGTSEQVRQHEERASEIWSKLVTRIGEEEAMRRIFG